MLQKMKQSYEGNYRQEKKLFLKKCGLICFKTVIRKKISKSFISSRFWYVNCINSYKEFKN